MSDDRTAETQQNSGEPTAAEAAPETAAAEQTAGAVTPADQPVDQSAKTAQEAAQTSAVPSAGDDAPTPSAPTTPAPSALTSATTSSPAPNPAAVAKRSTPLVPVIPVAAEYDDAKVAEAKTFGTVREDGVVTVQDGTQVREIGAVEPGTDVDEALTPFAHAYLDLAAFLDIVEQKLGVDGNTQADLNRILEQMRKNMKEPKTVGDIPALRQRAHDLREKAKEQIGELEKKRQAARDEATAKRTRFVESIEELVATDSHRISWKKAAATMRGMVGEWKTMQKGDVAIDRSVEDGLWKRLSAARSEFDRKRRAHFSQLDADHAEAEKVKAALIDRAEAMKDSEDFGNTARAYRELMDEWRAAPRGNRKKDDAQWAKFKAAQDAFFERRNADRKRIEGEQKENLKVKEAILDEAEALLPITDLDAAKEKMRGIEERFDAAGRVPRNAMRRVEDRIRAVRDALKKAEDAEWRRTDPRTRARVEGASSQLHSAIASYEEDLEKAKASGDAKRIEKAQAALDARREWLAVIERSAQQLN